MAPDIFTSLYSHHVNLTVIPATIAVVIVQITMPFVGATYPANHVARIYELMFWKMHYSSFSVVSIATRLMMHPSLR
jgi:hypothetical protein